MERSGPLTQLYWPQSCRLSEGFLIGWNIRGFICCVITVVQVPLTSIQEILTDTDFQLLGVIRCQSQSVESSEVLIQKNTADIWFTLQQGPDILIQDLNCCGFHYKVAAHVIYYDNSALAQHPCSLFRSKSSPESYVSEICSYLNRTVLVEKRLRDQFGLPQIHSEVHVDNKCGAFVWPVQVLFELVMWVYNWRVLGYSLSSVPYKSMVLMQIQRRLQDFYNWRSHSEVWTDGSPEASQKFLESYLKAYSSLCTIVLDLVLGLISFIVVSSFVGYALVAVHSLASLVHIDVLTSEVNWLMGLPAGFKPNVELDLSIGRSILTIVSYWNYVTTFLTRLEPQFVLVVAVIGSLGLSMQIALLSDIIDFCSIHIFYIYTLVGKLYALNLDVLCSLFRLFMGKKHNVLKKRIDTGEFGVDEQLLGTLIFTGLVFLYPTIAMYYLCFVSIWLLVQLSQAVLHVSLTLINECPLFLLWSYFAEPGFYSDGVFFAIQSSCQTTSYLELKSKKKPLSEVVAHCGAKVLENLKALSPGQLLKRAFLGHPIPHFTKSKRLT